MTEPILPQHLEAKGFYRYHSPKTLPGSHSNIFRHYDVPDMKVMEYVTSGGAYVYEPQLGALFFPKITTVADLEKFMFNVYANQT
jgi:hypothetical protein